MNSSIEYSSYALDHQYIIINFFQCPYEILERQFVDFPSSCFCLSEKSSICYCLVVLTVIPCEPHRYLIQFVISHTTELPVAKTGQRGALTTQNYSLLKTFLGIRIYTDHIFHRSNFLTLANFECYWHLDLQN